MLKHQKVLCFVIDNVPGLNSLVEHICTNILHHRIFIPEGGGFRCCLCMKVGGTSFLSNKTSTNHICK